MQKKTPRKKKWQKNKAIYLAQQSGRPNSGSTGTSGEGDVAGTQDANGIVEQNAAKALFQAHNFDLDLTLETRPTATNVWGNQSNGTSALTTKGITLTAYMAGL